MHCAVCSLDKGEGLRSESNRNLHQLTKDECEAFMTAGYGMHCANPDEHHKFKSEMSSDERYIAIDRSHVRLSIGLGLMFSVRIWP